MTTVDTFKLFLDKIKKENTSVIESDVFTRRFNDAQLSWLKSKAPFVEFEQSIDDDLQVLRVVTDGVMIHEQRIMYPIAPDVTNGRVFTSPIDPTVLIKGINGQYQPYPKYFRRLNCMFMIQYTNGWLQGLNSPWLKANILRSDKRAVMDSVYRQPTEGRLYYEAIANKIRLETGTNTPGIGMRLEYLRYPRELFFDETNLTDVLSNTNHTIGAGCVPCELADVQVKEIVEMMTIDYLENSSDERFQSYVNRIASQQKNQ